MSLTLAQLLQDPDRLTEIPPEHVPGLLGELERARALLWARLLAARAQDNGRAETPARNRPAQTSAPAEPDPSSQAGQQRSSDASQHVTRNSLLSAKEAARMLSCSEAVIRKWASRRQLPVVKVGRLTRLRLPDVEAFIAHGTRLARADKP